MLRRAVSSVPLAVKGSPLSVPLLALVSTDQVFVSFAAVQPSAAGVRSRRFAQEL